MVEKQHGTNDDDPHPQRYHDPSGSAGRLIGALALVSIVNRIVIAPRPLILAHDTLPQNTRGYALDRIGAQTAPSKGRRRITILKWDVAAPAFPHSNAAVPKPAAYCMA